jgi:DNA-binding transcriptional MerR regulator/methylmalonyl-CoA mutase cobalamin-binding subunit
MGTPDGEPTYSMRVVARMTGLSPDTIRKWESRHGAVHPDRSEGNTRKFSQEDVRRLSLLGELTGRGHRIGDLADLSAATLERMLGRGGPSGVAVPDEMAGPDRAVETLREQYLEAVGRYDVRRSAEIITRAAAVLGPAELATSFALPVLRATGDRWESGALSVGQEHLVSSQLRGLLTLVMQWSRAAHARGRIVVSTPPGHRHEFGALVASLILAGHGFEPVYLGPDLPVDDMLAAVEATGALALVLSVIRDPGPDERRTLARQIRKLAGRTRTWVGLPAHHGLTRHDTGATYFTSFEDLELELESL